MEGIAAMQAQREGKIVLRRFKIKLAKILSRVGHSRRLSIPIPSPARGEWK